MHQNFAFLAQLIEHFLGMEKVVSLILTESSILEKESIRRLTLFAKQMGP